MFEFDSMKQMSPGESGFEPKTKVTRTREFLDEMSLVVPWVELVWLIAQHAPTPVAPCFRWAPRCVFTSCKVVQPL